jgi:hypothetical protein
LRPRTIKYFQQRKKVKEGRPSGNRADDSLNSNYLRDSGISGISCGSSSEVKDLSSKHSRDVSSKSEVKFDLKLTDPFMSTTQEDTDAGTTEPSTVKTARDSGVSIEDSTTS